MQVGEVGEARLYSTLSLLQILFPGNAGYSEYYIEKATNSHMTKMRMLRHLATKSKKFEWLRRVLILGEADETRSCAFNWAASRRWSASWKLGCLERLAFTFVSLGGGAPESARFEFLYLAETMRRIFP